MSFMNKFMIRFCDITISIVLLLVLAPLIILISLVILIIDGKPIIFKQSRIGLNKKPFLIFKFRTMKTAEDQYENAKINLSEDDPSITKLGHFLRKTSLDELPQFVNVLKGEMSLVGPRPTVKSVVDQFDSNQLIRQTIKPGITGFAQINGRQKLDWDQKIIFDLKYVKNRTIVNYLIILFKTLTVVFKTNDTYKD